MSWESRGLGFQVKSSQRGVKIISHAIWADNIILFAADADMMTTMTQELTDAVAKGSLQWKPSSLQLLAGGTLAEKDIPRISVQQTGERLDYEKVDRLVLLGELLDATGTVETSRAYRQSIADALYY